MTVKRILHVVGCMDRGGIETWLMHVLRNCDRQRFQMDFLVETTKQSAYDDEILACGSKIIPCLHPSKPLQYAHNFKQLYCEHGPYDIIHSHIHNYSGYVLRLAKQVGIPIRIAHSHNDTSAIDAKARLSRRLYLGLTNHWIKQYATTGLACSSAAAAALYGSEWKEDSRWQLLYYGIDLSAFDFENDPIVRRSQFNIPRDALVIGHVGRFDPQKNHDFLIDIAAEVIKREPKAYFVLIGDGPLRSNAEKKVQQLGLSQQIIFAGLRSDVPQLMKTLMDVFLLPSLHEGLPLVLLEAQSAGLPCIFSDTVTEEANIANTLMQRVSLSQPADQWAEIILTANHAKPKITQKESLALVKESPFNIHISVQKLQSLYNLNSPKHKLVKV
ncbi:MAG: glycosyltransferase family 1 protein [Komarekiella atlantica HA4396-MV6]|jgi:glycosyltransferase involved in cell wall biosynthesis|nr:glycosyltransferase family 1 protein [Komarekiella atlantica HA4396-MV6]